MRAEEATNFAALEHLDERAREVLTRFHFEGQGHERIARDLGIQESHSRTTLARALARVTRVLRESEGDHTG